MLVGRCASRLFARTLLAHTACRAAAPCRTLWRPAPSALQLPLGARFAMADQRAAGGKQSSIAAFFGGGAQPKRAAASAATPPGGSGAAKRAADEAETLADTAAEAAEAGGAGGSEAEKPKLKRLRKAGSGAAEADAAPATAVAPPKGDVAVVSMLEDEEALPTTGAAAASRAALLSDDEVDEAEEESEREEEEQDEDEAGPSKPAPKKKRAAAAKKPTKVKGTAAGVGGRSHAAAAEYGKYDVLEAVKGEWKPGDPVPFLFLARAFEACGEVSARLEISAILANALRTIMATTPADLLPAVYLASCSVAPQYEGIDLGVGEAMLFKALAESTGRKEESLKKELGDVGDFGTLAMQCRATQRTMFPLPNLTIRGVFATLRDIAVTKGDKSTERKRSLIKKLLVSSRDVEAGYIMRMLQGKLGVGLAQQTVIAALAHAALLHEQDAAKKTADASALSALSATPLADRLSEADAVLKQVFSECPTWDLIVPALLSNGVMALPNTCHFVPGVPVKPMLAKATHGVAEIVERFANVEFTCEYKYDGERAQVHVLDNGEVRVFSRNMEDNTTKYPDIVDTFKAHLKPGVRSVVLDAEAVAYDRETKKILPFQVLSTRAKKSVAAEDVKVQVCLFAFDCLFADGRTLLREPLSERRRLLYGCLNETEGQLQFAKERTSRDLEELSVFLDESISANTEGLIVKSLDATYEPSKRSLNWLKLKKDYLEGEGGGDSLDLVVLGAWLGKGKRTGVYGAFLLACYDEESETYQSICKVGTGFSEQQLKDFADALKATVITAPPPYYVVGEGPNVTPDVWFNPTQVWEIKAADLSISPVHRAAAGLVDASKGIALRFPRLLRVRDDKKPEDATTSTQVAEFYRNQKINHTVHKGADDE